MAARPRVRPMVESGPDDAHPTGGDAAAAPPPGFAGSPVNVPTGFAAPASAPIPTVAQAAAARSQPRPPGPSRSPRRWPLVVLLLAVIAGVGAWFAFAPGDEDASRDATEADGRAEASGGSQGSEGSTDADPPADERTWVPVTDEASGLTWSMPEGYVPIEAIGNPVGVEGEAMSYESSSGPRYVSVTVWPMGKSVGLPGILNTLTHESSGYPFEQEAVEVNGRTVIKADLSESEGSDVIAVIAVLEVDGAMVSIQTTAAAGVLDRDGVDRIAESLTAG